MAKLGEIAESLKSANAGASWLTFDIGFAAEAEFDRVRESGAVRPEALARLYKVDSAEVRVYHYRPSLTIKATIPRDTFSDQAGERDFDGTQQYVPLLDIEVPES
jgi:hypothetical protein